jgi:hypothetical protein
MVFQRKIKKSQIKNKRFLCKEKTASKICAIIIFHKTFIPKRNVEIANVSIQ